MTIDDALTPRAAMLAGAFLLVLVPAAPAFAAVDGRPRAEERCLQTRIVLRPEKGATLADLGSGGRVQLQKVALCTFAVRTCVAHGEDVPASQCLR